MAGLLDRKITACGFRTRCTVDQFLVALVLFQDDSLAVGPHRCAPRLRQCLVGHRGVARKSPAAGRPGETTTIMAGRRWGGG